MATDSAQNRVLGLLTGISLQIFLAAAVFFIIAATTVSSVYSFLVPLGAEAVSQAASRELQGESPDSYESLRLISRFNLAWIYVTDESRQPVNGTKPYAPYLPNYLDRSRKLSYHGESFYEAVQPLKNAKYKLHLGFPLGSPLKDALNTSPIAAMLMPVRLGSLADFCLILALGVTAWVTAVLVLPLNVFVNGLNNLLKENKVNLDGFEKMPRPLIMVGELNQIHAAVKGLFIYFSSQERNSKEAVKEASERAAKWLKPRAQESEKLEQTLGRSVSGRLSDMLQERSNSQAPMARGFADLLKARDLAGNFTGELCGQFLEQFKDRVTGVVLLKPDTASERWLMAGAAGLNTVQVQTLSAMDLQAITAPLATATKISNLGPMSLKRSGLDSYISTFGARSVICAPIRHRNRTLACALLLAGEQFGPELILTLERTCNQASALYHGMLLAEEAREQIWTDPLTGLKNKSFIKELMSALGQEPYYFCHITVDTKEGLSNSEMESVAQDAAKILKAALRDFANLYQGAINGAEIGRLQKTEFAVLIKSESSDLITQLAGNFCKLLSQFIVEKRLESLGAGIAFSPRDGLNEDILVKAKLASLYAQETDTHVVKIQELPADFKPKRRAAAMQGELGVLDAAELLQSLLVGQRAGILTVDEGGRQAQLAMAQGKLLSARIGQFQGYDAVIEFLSTVESGSFNFQETQALPEANPSIPAITRCLMEAALAQDYLVSARSALQDMTSPVVAVKDGNLWQDLLGAEEVSAQEQQLLLHVLDKADGSKNVEQILRELENVPTAYRYRAVSMLINHGLLEKGILSRT